MSKPIVAVVGRPNVGKSTLFNDLAGQQISIVKDTPCLLYTSTKGKQWIKLGKNVEMLDTPGCLLYTSRCV